jgi:Protein of unknown function (DUF3102)
MSELQRVIETPQLVTLAEQINAEHRAFIGSLKKTAEHGIRAGELLTEAKSKCKHGQWLGWLGENFEGAPRTAQEYMRLHKHRDEIRAKYADSAHLSISGALKEVSEAGEAAGASAGGPPFRSTYLRNPAGGWIVENHYTIEEYAAHYGYRISPPLLIDAEFDALLPPLAADEYAGLERSIVQEGCRDPIIAWNNTILDGHARYEICVKHGIDYLVADKEMDSRNEAMIWIIDQQLGRKNLSDFEKVYIRAEVEVSRLMRERGISKDEAWKELLGEQGEA